MLNKKINPQEPAISPFFELLADAEEIQVREVMTTPTELVKEFDSSTQDEGQRAFVVRVKPGTPRAPISPDSEKTESSNTSQLLSSAKILLQNQDYLLARNIYSYVLKDRFQNGEALEGLGMCLYRLGDLVGARKCFQAIYELTESKKALYWLGMCASGCGDDQGTINYFGRISDLAALSRDELFNLHKELANAQLRMGSLDEAEKGYQSALTIQPESDIVYVNLGTLEIQRNHGSRALEHLDRATKINPNNPRAYCGMGLVHLMNQDLANAEASFIKTLEVEPINQLAIQQLVGIAHKTGQFATALQKVEKFLEREMKNNEVRFLLATLLHRQSRWRECETALDDILRVNPNHAKARELREEIRANRHQNP